MDYELEQILFQKKVAKEQLDALNEREKEVLKGWIMIALIVVIPAGIVIGLIAKAAKHIPKRYIDIMVMLQDRHTSRIVDQIEAAKAFDKGLTQGLKEDNTND